MISISKREIIIRTIGLLVLSSLVNPIAFPNEESNLTRQNLPSKELLDFLVEFEGTNDETFEAMLFYGQRDAQQAGYNVESESVNGEAENEEL